LRKRDSLGRTSFKVAHSPGIAREKSTLRAFHSGWVYGAALYERCASAYNLAGNTRKQDRHSGENEKETLLEFLPLHSQERASVSPCGCSPVEVKAAARQSQKLGSGQLSEDSEFL